MAKTARGVNIGNRPLFEAKMKGCQVREWIVGEKHVIFTNFIYDMREWRLLKLVSEIFNNIDRKTWREIKETLQWPPNYSRNAPLPECPSRNAPTA